MIINVEQIAVFTGTPSDGIVVIGSSQIAYQIQLLGLDSEVNESSVLIMYNLGESSARYVVLTSGSKVETWRLQSEYMWRKET